MKTTLSIMLLSVLFAGSVSAQKYITKTGHIRFFSQATLENIEANNKQVNAALDLATGEFVFKLLMKSFEFEKALMQEHFNENYVESDKYPNATFVGKVINYKDINLSKNGIYNATVEGDMSIHGVTKKIKQTGTFEVKDGKLIGTSKFMLPLADYNITIPKAVANNIANEVEVTVNVILEKLAK